MKTLSVIIVTFNSNDLIDTCLASLFKYNDIGDELEVIIVDNSSQEVYNNLYKKVIMNFPRVDRIVHSGSNLGYGAGNNIGISLSTGKYIQIMNPDVRLIMSLNSFLVAKFRSESCALIGLKEFNEFGQRNNSFFYNIENQNVFRLAFLQKIRNRFDLFNPRLHYLNGACFFMDKQKFLSVGGFDENIFLYSEEPDIAKRLGKLYGFDSIIYLKVLKYVHLKKLNGNSSKTLIHAIDSALYYLLKHGFDQYKYLKSRKKYSEIKRFQFFLTNNEFQHRIFSDICKYLTVKINIK